MPAAFRVDSDNQPSTFAALSLRPFLVRAPLFLAPLFLAPLLLALLLLPWQPAAAERLFGLALHGEPKYGPETTHLEYANPNAPKGGEMITGALGSFDSFNPFIVKGQAVSVAQVETLIFQPLDEPFTIYGLLAESFELAPDRSSITFYLRPEARFHDGEAIQADDVVYSFELITTKGHPFYASYFGDVKDVVEVDPLTVRFELADPENAELPLIVGQLPVLPKYYWEVRDFSITTLEPPLGSGPYILEDYKSADFILMKRFEDYWGKDLWMNRGKYNFDKMRTVFYADREAQRTAAKAGKFSFFAENSASKWATEYDNSKVIREGTFVKQEVPDGTNQGIQAYAMNHRRAPFNDPAFRRAMVLAFDFEWLNKNLFYETYSRSNSYYTNSQFASTTAPSEALRERLIAAGVSDPKILNEAYSLPVSDGSGSPREQLREASQLLKEAGYRIEDLRLIAPSGEPVRDIEVIYALASSERILAPYKDNLAKLGINLELKLLEPSQYSERLRAFDFDITTQAIPQSESPGNEQRSYFGCESADERGSRNLIGLCDPVVDRLIDALIKAKDREDLVLDTKALDHYLLHGDHVVPQFYIAKYRLLWDARLRHPEITPPYGFGLDTFWFDPNS